MATIVVSIEVDIPDGYAFDRWDIPKRGEIILKPNGKVDVCEVDWVNCSAIILCALKQHRKPSLPRDAGKLCEFSNDGRTWSVQVLGDYFADCHPWKTRMEIAIVSVGLR